MRRKERDKMNTLEEIKNTLALLRDDPCKVSSLLAYRQCKYCPLLLILMVMVRIGVWKELLYTYL